MFKKEHDTEPPKHEELKICEHCIELEKELAQTRVHLEQYQLIFGDALAEIERLRAVIAMH